MWRHTHEEEGTPTGKAHTMAFMNVSVVKSSKRVGVE